MKHTGDGRTRQEDSGGHLGGQSKRDGEQLNLFGESANQRLSFIAAEDRSRVLRELERAQEAEGPATSTWLKRSSRHPHE